MKIFLCWVIICVGFTLTVPELFAACGGGGRSGDKKEGKFSGERSRRQTSQSLKGKKKKPVPSGPFQVNSDPEIIDFKDPIYGYRIRQLYNPSGNEHNLYHYRSAFNADNSYMLGLQTNVSEKEPFHIVLYAGDGKFIKELYQIGNKNRGYSWKLIWDRHDPKILYTFRNEKRRGRLFQYNVETREATELKTLSKPIGAAGLSLNQAGDRILIVSGVVRAANGKNMPVVKSFRLPDMTEERSFSPELPNFCMDHKRTCNIHSDKIRYTGYKNYISFSVNKNYKPGGGFIPQEEAYIYEDTGEIYRKFDGISFGHTDHSPDGKFAYYSDRRKKVHVLDFENNTDEVVFEVTERDMNGSIRTMHVSWPKNVKDWFILAITPRDSSKKRSYSAPYDELMRVYTDGRSEILARHGTRDITGTFWFQPQPSVSADGSRISFNSTWAGNVKGYGGKSSGTIDQCILFLDTENMTSRNPQHGPRQTVLLASPFG